MWELLGAKERGDSFPGDPARPSLVESLVNAGSSSARCPRSPQALRNQDSAPAKCCWGSSALVQPFVLVDPARRFLKARANTGFVFRRRNIVWLHLPGDSQASLAHLLEVGAHLASVTPDLPLEKLQRVFEGCKQPLSALVMQPSGK